MNNKSAIRNYLQSQSLLNQRIIERIRKIILRRHPELEEHMRMGVIFYGERYYIIGLEDHVNMGFDITTLTVKERQQFEGEGRSMRHLKFYSENDIDARKISRLIDMIESKFVLV